MFCVLYEARILQQVAFSSRIRWLQAGFVAPGFFSTTYEAAGTYQYCDYRKRKNLWEVSLSAMVNGSAKPIIGHWSFRNSLEIHFNNLTLTD